MCDAVMHGIYNDIKIIFEKSYLKLFYNEHFYIYSKIKNHEHREATRARIS